MLFIGCIHGNDTLLITSGLFGIAGSIATLAESLSKRGNYDAQ
jgi:hypothetical protein